jgi:hypothetical protein
MKVGDLPAARAHLEAAAQAGQQIRYQDQDSMANLGFMLRAQGDPHGARSLLEAALRASRRNGGNRAMAIAILGLACLATDAADWHRAAALHGSAQAIHDQAGMHWEELEARFRQDSLDQARAHLGDEQLERAYTQGMTISIENRPRPGSPESGSGLIAILGLS